VSIDVVYKKLSCNTIFHRICYRTSELYEITLLMSGGILPEMKAVWQGHSLNIIKCLRDVDNLEVDLEVCPSKSFSS
jgi:hypothetical protein